MNFNLSIAVIVSLSLIQDVTGSLLSGGIRGRNLFLQEEEALPRDLEGWTNEFLNSMNRQCFEKCSHFKGQLPSFSSSQDFAYAVTNYEPKAGGVPIDCWDIRLISGRRRRLILSTFDYTPDPQDNLLGCWRDLPDDSNDPLLEQQREQEEHDNACHQKCLPYAHKSPSFSTKIHLYQAITYYNATHPDAVPMDCWDVSKVTDMTNLFQSNSNFNQPIGCWETSQVTSMSGTFYGASSFNQDIGKWKTGNVTKMDRMFVGAKAFNQDIGSWDTGRVLDMKWMFFHNKAFNQDIGRWNISSVENMEFMFNGAETFNQYIGDWNTSSVLTMKGMFFRAKDFNQDIGKWNTTRVTNMNRMFTAASNFNQYIGDWNVDNLHVNGLNHMFTGATAFNQPLCNWYDAIQRTDANIFHASGCDYPNDITVNQVCTTCPRQQRELLRG